MNKLFFLGLLLLIAGCHSNKEETKIGIKTYPATTSEWICQIEGVESFPFITDSIGETSLTLKIDTINHVLFIHPSTQFVAETWIMPGEECKVELNRVTKNLEQQISTTGVFKERTKAAYSQTFGHYYQLLANDNFYIPLNSDEKTYVDFIINLYKEHIDTLASHNEWPNAVKQEALRTLNNKMLDRIEDPKFWLEFCADLRGYKGEVAPTSLSDKNRKKASEVMIK